MSNKIPELTLATAEKALNAYCEKKVPIHLRDQIRLYGKKRGVSLTLIESRPAFMNKAEWTENPVAQFRYANGLWVLYCADRNERWHEYTETDPEKNIVSLLAAVDEDVTGIFWG